MGLENEHEDVVYIHVTLLPYISGSNELKSKPTQHSVKELQVSGVRPDIIVARCGGRLPYDVKQKISLFCNVKLDCVIENLTVNDLYEAPIMLEEQNLSEIVCRELHIDAPNIDLTHWNNMLEKVHSCKEQVTIGLVGKYVRLHDAYLSVIESLRHGGYENGTKVNIKWIEAEDITNDTIEDILGDVDGIIVPGGFGDRGIEGKVAACRYARENNVPYLGLCLGMQIAVIEFARNVLGYEDANSREFDELSTHKVIDFMPGQNDDIDKGGTMRLGAYPCSIKEGSLLAKCYGTNRISERHRHRYEFTNKYRDEYNEKGLEIVGTSPDGRLVEAVENVHNDFFVGVQYHPEFKSRPDRAHPLFTGFIKASLNNKMR